MKTRSDAIRFFSRAFWFLAALRFLSVIPFVIDDDEAWSSAAANAMRAPWEFYRSAVDHKPPGFVWFYWFTNWIVPCLADPRVVRGLYCLLTIGLAGVLGWMAYRFRTREGDPRVAGWSAATFFLLANVAASPKLLAVTADGLLTMFVVLAYAIALFVELPCVTVIAGALLGAGLLVKQTGVFFAIPILFARWPRKWSVREIGGFALGSALVLVPAIVALDPREFLYWNWTYPSEVLIRIREHVFGNDSGMLWSLGTFTAATLPLTVAALRFRPGHGPSRYLGDFRVLWCLAGIAAMALGKGLFLHYFLSIVPALVLMAAEFFSRRDRVPRLTFTWLGLGYVAACVMVAVPRLGVFWGTDLGYFDKLSREIRQNLKPGERVMVWGGSALPLAMNGTEHVTRFVLPRFAVAPYATDRTRALFHQELTEDPPALIVDLHERGDNRFDNPIESEPFVAAQIRSDYHLYVSPVIPWAKFYLHGTPLQGSGLRLAEGSLNVKRVYAPFPVEDEPWKEFVTVFRKQRLPAALTQAVALDWTLRARAALELLERQSLDSDTEAEARRLKLRVAAGDVDSRLQSEVEGFIHRQARIADLGPLPWNSPFWWPEVALVQLQPKAYQTADVGRRASDKPGSAR